MRFFSGVLKKATNYLTKCRVYIYTNETTICITIIITIIYLRTVFVTVLQVNNFPLSSRKCKIKSQ